MPDKLLAGLEKILRFLQSLVLIAVSFLPPLDATPYNKAKSALGLGRRYLRFFKLFPLLATFFHLTSNPEMVDSGFLHLLEVGKAGFGALYLLGQNLTTLDAMGFWKVEWAGWVMMEANRFWFYSLICAVVLTLHSLVTIPSPAMPTSTISKSYMKKLVLKKAEIGAMEPELLPGQESAQEKTAFGKRAEAGLEKRRREEYQAKCTQLVKDLIMHTADLFIPGEAVGWIKVEAWVVGSAMAISTLLASEEIWARVNGM